MFDQFRNLRFEDIRSKPTPNNKNSGGGWSLLFGGRDFIYIYIYDLRCMYIQKRHLNTPNVL